MRWISIMAVCQTASFHHFFTSPWTVYSVCKLHCEQFLLIPWHSWESSASVTAAPETVLSPEDFLSIMTPDDSAPLATEGSAHLAAILTASEGGTLSIENSVDYRMCKREAYDWQNWKLFVIVALVPLSLLRQYMFYYIVCGSIRAVSPVD